MRLHKVEQGVWGADRSETLYFDTKRNASKYVKEHDVCNYAGYVCRSENECSKLLAETAYLLNR